MESVFLRSTAGSRESLDAYLRAAMQERPCFERTRLKLFTAMWRNRVYYGLKPFIPKWLRMLVRSRLARNLEGHIRDVWPIMPGSERKPVDWPGWPGGKRFALVLTHDVEGKRGLHRCDPLIRLESDLGFRSSFNFIPEGPYEVSSALREQVTAAGFEVGVHDLKHDGWLFQSKRGFARKSTRINHYLGEWGAAGFRAGFMFHRLDWFHQLNITYDASTFDTDPFEPQPEGRHTIFPFWVPAPENGCIGGGMEKSGESNSAGGYVELPYTLPQDSTLFLLLEQRTPEIWLKKLDWIAQHGGMALVNVHPDYLCFDGEPASTLSYPVQYYREFLEQVRQRYMGEFWNPLPRELAAWFKGTVRPSVDLASEEREPVPEIPARLHGKRVAVLLYSYYPADPRPRRAAEALAESGAHVDLVCLRENESEPECEKIQGVTVHRVSLQRKRGNMWTYLKQYAQFIASCFAFLTRRSLNIGYDLVHVHNMPDVLVFASLVPKLLGSRILLDLHDPMPELMPSIFGLRSGHWVVGALRRAEQWSIRFADMVITPNLAFQDLFISRGCPPEKIGVVMNSPETKIFNPDRHEDSAAHAERSSDEFRVMHHGSIVHRHGVDMLVEAIARVRPEIPGVRLDIYGARTPFLDEVLEIAKRLGVGDIVHYHGPKAQSEIASAIRNCHVGVVPNRRSPFTELNFPTRLFEYLAIHRPVIAPHTRGIRDYFESADLVTFEPDNVEDLARMILWVRHHPEEVHGTVERGRQVYRRNMWPSERKRFLNYVARLTDRAGKNAVLNGAPKMV